MKGLFLNGFYSSTEYLKPYSIFIAAAAAAVLLIRSGTVLELFVYMIIPIFSMNSVSVSGRDLSCRWSKFEIALPVCRRDIVKSKYFIYLFWSLVGAAFAFAVSIAAMFLHGDLFFNNGVLIFDISGLCSTFALGIGISFFAGAYFHPICYLTGAGKNDISILISLLMAMGTSVVSLNVLNRYLSSFAVRMGIFVAFYVISFAVSYLLSLCIYRKKEF